MLLAWEGVLGEPWVTEGPEAPDPKGWVKTLLTPKGETCTIHKMLQTEE